MTQPEYEQNTTNPSKESFEIAKHILRDDEFELLREHRLWPEAIINRTALAIDKAIQSERQSISQAQSELHEARVRVAELEEALKTTHDMLLYSESYFKKRLPAFEPENELGKTIHGIQIAKKALSTPSTALLTIRKMQEALKNVDHPLSSRPKMESAVIMHERLEEALRLANEQFGEAE